jgi:ribosome-associated translation inhibitor RaiA
MADVRSLLRAERAARAPPKARKPEQALASPPRLSKKRKADDDDATDTRKRTKAKGFSNLPSAFFDATEADPLEEEEEQIEEPSQPLDGFVAATEAPPALPQSTSKPTKDLDEEWAAFEQDIASIPEPKSALDALNANAVLEAAPISATEATSQSLEGDATIQKGRRDVEMEEEKEDASRALEEEFEEMEVLEERLKRLKEKREQLRASKSEAINHIAAQPEAVLEDGSNEDDEDEDDEWDGWRFGTS